MKTIKFIAGVISALLFVASCTKPEKDDPSTPTALVSVSAESSDVTFSSAKISGNLLSAEYASTMSIKVYYSKTAKTLSELKSSKSFESAALDMFLGSYKVSLSGLSYSTTYYFATVAQVDGAEFASEVKTFKTKDFDLSSCKDLSSGLGAANCYIVSSQGYYKFKPTKGRTSNSVGSITCAEVLWESFGTNVAPTKGDLVSCVSYSDGYIIFTAKPAKGNAVVAAKDASGNILWSWHIWFTDQPQDQVYNCSAGTMMDRNLGATSATPGDVKALGLLYQWGRKDPFLGSSSISSNTQAASTISWPHEVYSNSSNGTIAYATAHPTTFISYYPDWFYTGSSSTDDTRWAESKDLYDPCPAGYYVPHGYIWYDAFRLGTSLLSFWTSSSNWDSTNKGMNFGKTDRKLGSGTIWYPASGYLEGHTLYNVGSDGYYTSRTSVYGDDGMSYALYFRKDGTVYSVYGANRNTAKSVRCLKE